MLLQAIAHSHPVDFQVVLRLLLCRGMEQSHECLIPVMRANSSFPEQPNGQSAAREGWRCGFHSPVCLEALFCGIMEHKHSFRLSHR